MLKRTSFIFWSSAAILTSMAAALSCWSGTGIPDQTGTGETDGYKLVWADYFDNGTLDPDKWTCEENGFGGGNAELQYYAPGNVSVSTDKDSGRGCLKITARKDSLKGKAFTSGRLKTEGKFAFTYGKVEASIKLPPTANGLWPAFWLLGADYQTNLWPSCGEIDILEMGHADGIREGIQDRYYNGACHWGRYQGENHPNTVVNDTSPYSLQDGNFHLYTLIWEPDYLSFWLDKDKYPEREPYFTLDIRDLSWFHHDYFIILNLVVGGFFTGILDPEEITALNGGPAVMEVDFVKVYQRESSSI